MDMKKPRVSEVPGALNIVGYIRPSVNRLDSLRLSL